MQHLFKPRAPLGVVSVTTKTVVPSHRDIDEAARRGYLPPTIFGANRPLMRQRLISYLRATEPSRADQMMAALSDTSSTYGARERSKVQAHSVIRDHLLHAYATAVSAN